MKKKFFMALLLVNILLVSTAIVVHAGTTGAGAGACQTYISGNNIVSYGAVQYSGGTPYWMYEAVTMLIKNTPGQVAFGSSGTVYHTSGPVSAYAYAPVAYHHGEKIFTSCYHSYSLSGSGSVFWTTTSNTVTVP